MLKVPPVSSTVQYNSPYSLRASGYNFTPLHWVGHIVHDYGSGTWISPSPGYGLTREEPSNYYLSVYFSDSCVLHRDRCTSSSSSQKCGNNQILFISALWRQVQG